MLTTRAVGVGWLGGVITLIPACCVAIATFVGIVCNTLWKDCAGFDVTFICCSNAEAVVIDVTFTFVAI